MLKVLITVLNEVPDYTTTFGYGKKGVYKCRCFTLMDYAGRNTFINIFILSSFKLVIKQKACF